MKPYPIFLVDLASRPCIVIGGGNEGEFKVKGLLDCDAAVTLISLHLTPQLQTWAEEGWLTWIKRHYLPGDLEGAFLVIAERSDPETNAQIWQEAQTEGALINVMDDVPHCNFVAGSVIRRGPLVVSISTSGAAPALSVRLRERLTGEFGPEYQTFLIWMQALRQPMAAHYPDFAERRRRWYAMVDSDALDLLREHNLAQARQRISELSGLDAVTILAETPPTNSQSIA